MDAKYYIQAMNLSFPASPNESIFIPVKDNEITSSQKLWFDPLGISSITNMGEGNDIVLLTDYSMPGFGIAQVIKEPGQLRLGINWVRTVKNITSGTDVRLFPNLSLWAGKNVIQTANMGPDKNIWISRNGGRRFYLISNHDDKFYLTKCLTVSELMEKELLINSAVFTINEAMKIIVSDQGFKKWHRAEVEVHSYSEFFQGELKLQGKIQPVTPWNYGLDVTHDGKVWTITDHRIKTVAKLKKEYGIYLDGKMICPDVYGNGLCFLSDGSMLISCYGPASYEASVIKRIPASLLK